MYTKNEFNKSLLEIVTLLFTTSSACLPPSYIHKWFLTIPLPPWVGSTFLHKNDTFVNTVNIDYTL